MNHGKILFPALAITCIFACVTEVPREDDERRYRCEEDSDCLDGYFCVGGFCDEEGNSWAFCGDEKIEGDEVCDGTNLNSETCNTVFGFENGKLACKPDCSEYDGSGCYTCGDGQVDGIEECDGTNFEGADCLSDTGLEQGELVCTINCKIDSSACHTCGNDQIEGPEVCDGKDVGSETCSTVFGMTHGELACEEDCSSFDGSGCYTCGDGQVDGIEECDGTNFEGADCLSVTGLDQGELVCTGSCKIDSSACHTCGNDQIEGPEVCDGTDLGEESCGTQQGFDGGELACTEDCSTIVTEGCYICGDGICEHESKGESTESCREDCGWRQISAGEHYTCAVKNDGSAWCWGLDEYQKLGNGGASDREYYPSRVGNHTPITNVDKIDASRWHTCAVKKDGTAWCWGRGIKGELGNGEKVSSPLPVQVTVLENIRTIATAVHVTCAVTYNDDAWCWGLDWNGVLGTTELNTGDSTATPVMVEVPAGVDIRDIKFSVGVHGPSACALSNENNIYCWGSNQYGQVADGTTNHRGTPVKVEGISGVTTISNGFYQFGALKTDGSLYVWGHSGRCGDFGAEPAEGWDDCGSNPCLMNPYELLSAGNGYSIEETASGVRGYLGFLDQNSNAWVWGRNAHGELGTGDNDGGDGQYCEVDGEYWPYFKTPQRVALDVELNQVSIGHYHGCAIDVDGHAWCWGRADGGELGIGTGNAPDESFSGLECSFSPMRVVDPYGAE